MTSVGVRELRQRASELLRRVAAGETIEVTDRGRPVALLSPLPKRVQLERLRVGGEVSLASRGSQRPSAAVYRPARARNSLPPSLPVCVEMSAERAVYLDSSAIVKLAIQEPESTALRAYLRRRRPLVSSSLARAEVARALAPLGEAAVRRGQDVLARIDLIRVIRPHPHRRWFDPTRRAANARRASSRNRRTDRERSLADRHV